MAQRFRPRLSFANVISVIALFAAMGGGYAVAFSGSGTLQKGQLQDIPSSYMTVRSLTGIGSIDAKCSNGPTTITVRFTNTSGEPLTVQRDEGGTDPVGLIEPNGDDQETGVAANETLRYHIYPNDGTKRPQADVTVSAVETGAGCSFASVSVLALNTEE